MLPLDIKNDINYRIINVSRLSKKGEITTDSGEVIRAPASRVRTLINYYKATTFATPVPAALIYILGELIDVETYAYTSSYDIEKDENGVSHYKYAAAWKPTVHYRLEALYRAVEEKENELGQAQWYCDGVRLYRPSSYMKQIDNTGNWFLAGALSVPVKELKMQLGRTDRLDKTHLIIYRTSCGEHEQAICVNTTAVIHTARRSLERKKGDSYQDLTEKITPSLAFLIRAANGWSELFGDHVMEDIEIHKLLIHFGTCNLLTIPQEVRQSCATGISYQGLLARSIGLCAHARNLYEAEKLQSLVQSLLSDGYVWKNALEPKNIYKNTSDTVPALKDTSQVLSQFDQVRNEHLKNQVA